MLAKACFIVILSLVPLHALHVSKIDSSASDVSGTLEKAIFLLGQKVDLYERVPKLLKELQTCSWLTSVPAYVLVDELPQQYLLGATLAAWPNVSVIDVRAKGLWTPPDEYKDATHFKGGGNFGLGYRQMCDFWSTKIMHLAKDLGVDVYMRLDTDSVMTCRNQKNRVQFNQFKQATHVFHVQRDLFDIVTEGDHVYGYYKPTRDPPFVSKGVNHLLKAYAHEHGLDLSDKIGSNLMEQKDGEGALTYYNNLEVAKVDYFLTPAVQNFTDRIAESHGIYDYRWGDAIIRFWQVALFSTPKDVVCFGPNLGVHYHHQRWGRLGMCNR